MPTNSNEYDRRYRNLRKEKRKFEEATVLKIFEELQNLRKEVENLRKDSGSNGSLPPDPLSSLTPSTPLPSSSKKVSPQKLGGGLADWQPSIKHRELARSEGRDEVWLCRQAEKYRDHQPNAKLKHRDFEAGFRNWIRNAVDFESSQGGPPRPATNGRTNGHSTTEHMPSYGRIRDPTEIMAEIEARDRAKEQRR